MPSVACSISLAERNGDDSIERYGNASRGLPPCEPDPTTAVDTRVYGGGWRSVFWPSTWVFAHPLVWNHQLCPLPREKPSGLWSSPRRGISPHVLS